MSASNANATQKWVSDKYTPLTDFDKLRKDLPNIFQVRGNYASSGSFDKFQKSIENEYMQRKEADGKYQPKGNYQPAGQYITKPELQAANFATKGDLASYQPVGDYQIKGNYQPAGDYALKSELSAFQPKGNYQPAGDYQPKGNYQTAGDYALKSDLSVFQPKGNYQTAGDYQPKGNYQPAGDYALKSDLSGFQAKGEYALKGDLSGFQPKGEYALKGDLTGFQPKGEYALKGDLTGFQPKGEYALKGDLTGFQPKGDYVLKRKPISYFSSTKDTDYAGNDIKYYPDANTDDDCAKLCKDDKECKMFVRPTTGKGCWTKNAIGMSTKNNDRQSFLKTQRTSILPANVATKGDLATYALKSDIVGLQPKGDYALKSEIPKGDSGAVSSGFLGDKAFYLRNSGDTFHGLAYGAAGDGAKWNIDGPVLWGNANGALAAGGLNGPVALTWDKDKNVKVAGILDAERGYFKGGVSVHNPEKFNTHFSWKDDNKNYIRGDTELRGNLNNIGDLNVGGKFTVGGIELQPKGDYALKSDIPKVVGSSIVPANVATKGDLATYALKSDLNKYAEDADLKKYQVKGDYALKSDLNKYAEDADLKKYQLKGDYALKSDIPKGTTAVGASSLGSDNLLIKYASQGEPEPKGIKGSTLMLFGPNAKSFDVNKPPKNPPKNLPLILSNGDGSMMAISADNIYMGSSDSNVNINGKQVNINGELIVSGAKLTPRDYALKSDIPKGVVGGDASEMIKKSSMWCADGAVCKIPAGSKGIDWGYGGSKIYDDSQLNIESDDNIYFRTGSKNKVIVNNDGAVVDGKLIVKGELDVNAINISGWKVEGGPENSLVFRRGNANDGDNQPYLRMAQDGNFWVSRSTARGWVPDNIQKLNNKTSKLSDDGSKFSEYNKGDLDKMWGVYNDRDKFVRKDYWNEIKVAGNGKCLDNGDMRDCNWDNGYMRWRFNQTPFKI